MSNIYSSVTELVGRTPLLELGNIERELGLGAHLVAKLESCNPAGSVTDRVALEMIDDAERSGRLSAGATVIELTEVFEEHRDDEFKLFHKMDSHWTDYGA
ncbi:MAG: pyridoxal-phosphate dependent enzyme, partial [Clostridia bacterium]|nr:pyridoxal-phosphate dependent enzyme [Clostridia bacterium]